MTFSFGWEEFPKGGSDEITPDSDGQGLFIEGCGG